MRVFSATVECDSCAIVMADACSDSMFSVLEIPCPKCGKNMKPRGAIRSRKADDIDAMVFNEFGHRRVPYRPGDLD